MPERSEAPAIGIHYKSFSATRLATDVAQIECMRSKAIHCRYKSAKTSNSHRVHQKMPETVLDSGDIWFSVQSPGRHIQGSGETARDQYEVCSLTYNPAFVLTNWLKISSVPNLSRQRQHPHALPPTHNKQISCVASMLAFVAFQSISILCTFFCFSSLWS